MNLLFITSSRIGDAVLSTGLLHYMIGKHPGIEVTVASAPLTLPLFENVPHLKRLIPIHKRSFHRHWYEIWKQCHHEQWDIIIDIRGGVISHFLKAQERYIWKSSHAHDHRIFQLGRLIGKYPPPSPHLWLNEENLERSKTLLPVDVPLLAIAPAANWIGKQWPTASFEKLVTLFLKNFPAKVAVFAAPQERSIVQPLLDSIPQERKVDLVGSLSLLETAACLKRCKVFVGNDSGLMHMAAAVNTPTLGLFGPSDERIYAPYNPPGKTTHQVLRTPESLETLKKRPDFSFDAPHCFMNNLAPETAYQALKELWSKASTS